MTEKINKVIKALEKNNMQGIYVERIEEISPLVEKMLFDGAMIATGGSVSLQESGVCKLINNGNYKFLDRNQKDITQQQKK